MADNFIAGAIKKPGALHTDLHVPQGKKIPAGKLAAAAKASGKLGERARFAQTLEGLRPKADRAAAVAKTVAKRRPKKKAPAEEETEATNPPQGEGPKSEGGAKLKFGSPEWRAKYGHPKKAAAPVGQ
jgi:hypothetical protein